MERNSVGIRKTYRRASQNVGYFLNWYIALFIFNNDLIPSLAYDKRFNKHFPNVIALYIVHVIHDKDYHV